MPKIDTTVGKLVEMVVDRELRLPALQRRYVWPATRVRDLLDSLYRMYPSGTILVWETDRESPSRDLDVEVRDTGHSGGKLLLDGQQRLTSLAAVLKGKAVKVRNRKRPIDILFNLDHPDGPPIEVLEVNDAPEDPDDTDLDADDPDETTIQDRLKLRTFVVGSRALLADRRWVKVSDVFIKSDAELLKGLVKSLDDPLFDKYSQRLQAVRKIRDYPYVMHVLDKSLSYEEVAEIFVRVNSLGTKLRGSDLAIAQITSRWEESLDLFEEFQADCEDQYYAFDLGLIIRALVVFTTSQSRFRSVTRTPIASFKENWAPAKKGIIFALNWVRENAKVEDDSLLSSPYFLITLAYLAHSRGYRLNEEEDNALRRWLYVANARGHYSGSSETTLDNDLNVIKRGEGAKRLLENLGQRFRDRFDASDLAGRGQRSPIFATAYMALKARGAKDWASRVGLSLAHKGREHFIEHHHIFPKALLKGMYEPSEINELANMAFVAGGTNRRLGKSKPEEYLPKVIQEQGAGALAAHCVPQDPALWKIENFRSFLEYRRAALAAEINEFIHQGSERGEAPLTAIIAGGENESVEFKSSARWDYNEKRANKTLESVIVKTVAGFLNARGGTLLIGIADDGTILGLDADYATLGKRPDRDGYQQMLVGIISAAVGQSVLAHVRIGISVIDGKEVCRLTCSPSPLPVYVTDNGVSRLFARTANTTQELLGRQLTEYVSSRWTAL